MIATPRVFDFGFLMKILTPSHSHGVAGWSKTLVPGEPDLTCNFVVEGGKFRCSCRYQKLRRAGTKVLTIQIIHAKCIMRPAMPNPLPHRILQVAPTRIALHSTAE